MGGGGLGLETAGPGEAFEEPDRLAESGALAGRDDALDGPGEPGVARRDRRLEQAVARRRDADDALAAVGRVGLRADEPRSFQRRERLRDRLVCDVFGGGQRGRGGRPFVAQPFDDCDLRDRQLDAGPGRLADPRAQALERDGQPDRQRVGGGNASSVRGHVTSMSYTSHLRKWLAYIKLGPCPNKLSNPTAP